MYHENYRDTVFNLIDTPKQIFNFSNCIVDLESGVIFANGQIIWECANEALMWWKRWVSSDERWNNRISRCELILSRMQEIDISFKLKLEKGVVGEITGKTVLHLLHPFGFYAYGHFFDTMQKLSIIDHECINYDAVLLSNTNRVVDFQKHAVALGLDKKEQITTPWPQNRNALLKVDNLIYVQPLATPTNYIDDSLRFLQNRYLKAYSQKSDEKLRVKLFLTRKKEVNPRYLVNHDELCQHLLDENIIVLDGTEPLEDVISKFGLATHICGVHGALFSNILFAGPDVKIREYCPRSRPTSLFLDQYKLSGNYDFILCDSDETHNVKLNLNELLEFFAS